MRLSYFRNELLIRNRFLLNFKLEIWFTVYSYAWEVRTFNEIMRAIQRKICATAEHPTKNSIWSLYLAYVHTFNLHIRIELEKIKTCLLFYDDHRKKRRHETTPLLWDLPMYLSTYRVFRPDLIYVFWRPQIPSKNNFYIKMKVFVYFWGLGIWVSLTSF